MKLLDIGEVAAQSGVRPSTLRYYDDRGLITSAGRHGLRRQFLPDVLLQLKLIGMGKAAGFSLTEIAAMFSPEGRPDLPRADLHKRADQLDRQIRELGALRDMLRHVADCPAPSHMDCPTFRRIVDLAGRNEIRRAERRTSRAKRRPPAKRSD